MAYILIAAGVFILDFIIKTYVDRKKKLDQPEMIFGGRLILRKYYNKGAAMNFLAGHPETMKTIHAFILGGITGVYGLLLKTKNNRVLKIGLSFILGGGLSNLFDRITKKHVVDYFSFPVKWKKLRGIIFNISDMFVFFGAVLAVLSGKK